MTQRYPRAVDLAQMAHCSACGETNPLTDDDGDTTCCARRECPGMGPEAQDVCCAALQDRVDHESAHGTPPTPVGLPPAPPRPRVKSRRSRSTRIDETRGLHSGSADANLVSHQGVPAPTTSVPKEPAMALSTKTATRIVLRQLVVDGPYSKDALGYSFGRDREQWEQMARAYLGDKTELATSTINNADYDELFAEFQDDLPQAPAAPAVPAAQELAPAPVPAVPAAAPRGARAALGAASAPGWELLYDKPRAGAEVGRRYVDGKPEFALICKTHGHVHALARLGDEGGVRKAGGWCPAC